MDDLFEFLFEVFGEIFGETYIDLYTNLFSSIFPNHRGRKWIEVVGTVIGIIMFIATLALLIWGIYRILNQLPNGVIIIAGAVLFFIFHLLIGGLLRRRNA